MHDAEIRYLPLEKAILAVVHNTRKLPHYFQAHMVVVLTQLPLKATLRSADYTRRIAKWGTILGVFDIKYMPRTSVKGQVLADLVAEFTETPVEDKSNEHCMDWLVKFLYKNRCSGRYMWMGQQIRKDLVWG